MTRRPVWRGRPDLRERAQQLRYASTEAEARLWDQLRSRQLGGLKFRRQHPVGRFIVDFYCAERQLVIELDGSVHDAQAPYDDERTATLEQRGYRVVRFRNDDVIHNIQSVLDPINQFCTE